jgi:hypothetical protein
MQARGGQWISNTDFTDKCYWSLLDSILLDQEIRSICVMTHWQSFWDKEFIVSEQFRNPCNRKPPERRISIVERAG